jgi:branched-chain amino acid transport system permease protein
MVWTNALLQGLLTGGLYALLASGLSLVFGVMRIVNLAHGDFSILAAFLVLTVAGQSNLWLGTIAVLPVMALLGYSLQRSLLNKSISMGVLSPLLITFAFSIIIQNVLLKVFSSDTRSIQTDSLGSSSIKITDSIYIGLLPLLTFAIGVLLTLAIHFYLMRTRGGRAMRATSDDPTAAELVGINNRHIYGLATGIGLFAAGIAGILFGMRTQFSPSLGPIALIFAFEAVIIGGLGSLWGTLLGGIVLGVAQSIGAQINPAYGVLTGHIVFILILLIRPQGLLPKQRGK